MADEQERLEAAIWGQNVKVAMVSIIPLLLIILLGVDAYLLMKHSKEISQATSAAAQYIVQDARELVERQQVELRAENTNRSHEHGDILKLINGSIDQQNRMFLETVADQNELFLQAIAKKAMDDTKQHQAVERAVIRTCRATDKAFAELEVRDALRVVELARLQRAFFVDAALLNHLNQKETR